MVYLRSSYLSLTLSIGSWSFTISYPPRLSNSLYLKLGASLCPYPTSYSSVWSSNPSPNPSQSTQPSNLDFPCSSSRSASLPYCPECSSTGYFLSYIETVLLFSPLVWQCKAVALRSFYSTGPPCFDSNFPASHSFLLVQQHKRVRVPRFWSTSSTFSTVYVSIFSFLPAERSYGGAD